MKLTSQSERIVAPITALKVSLSVTNTINRNLSLKLLSNYLKGPQVKLGESWLKSKSILKVQKSIFTSQQSTPYEPRE